MEDRKHRSLNRPSATPESPSRESIQDRERRRMSRIVHDDKGNATVQWVEAPADYERQVLELEKDPGEAYARGPDIKRASQTTRTDLRKLSSWIKLMRSLEEAKKRDRE